jgi:hypothetical protein
MQVRERMTRQETLQLRGSFCAREPQVQIEDHHAARALLELGVRARLHEPALLALADRQIDARRVGQGEAAEDRVAITTHAKPMLGAERDVPHVERLRQLSELIVHTAAGHALSHLLQHQDVRLEGRQHRNRALEAIAPIDSADTLVDVPGRDAKAHGSESPSIDQAASTCPWRRRLSGHLALGYAASSGFGSLSRLRLLVPAFAHDRVSASRPVRHRGCR